MCSNAHPVFASRSLYLISFLDQRSGEGSRRSKSERKREYTGESKTKKERRCLQKILLIMVFVTIILVELESPHGNDPLCVHQQGGLENTKQRGTEGKERREEKSKRKRREKSYLCNICIYHMQMHSLLTVS